MKQPEDIFTADLFQKRGRGRPRKPNAKTGAQRMREYRLRRRRIVLETPLYIHPKPSFFVTGETLPQVVLRAEKDRHAERLTSLNAIDTQLRLLEPVIRELEKHGIFLQLNDIVLRGDALVVRDTGSRAKRLLDVLQVIGLHVLNQTHFPRHTVITLGIATLKLSLCIPLTINAERNL